LVFFSVVVLIPKSISSSDQTISTSWIVDTLVKRGKDGSLIIQALVSIGRRRPVGVRVHSSCDLDAKNPEKAGWSRQFQGASFTFGFVMAAI
jgi:hypothetical protein